MQIRQIERIGAAAFLMPAALENQTSDLMAEIERISAISPFRQMATRKGVIAVAMTNCGEMGWLSDQRGYRYTKIDPLTGKNWPSMPDWVQDLAALAAQTVGFANFKPNCCLINKYAPATRLGQHIDKDEGEYESPIVSFSFGLSALFRWGGLQASDKTKDHLIKHVDILVWGAQSRLCYHGIAKTYPPDLESTVYRLQHRFVMTFRHCARSTLL